MGTISVILATQGRIGTCSPGVMSIAQPCTKDSVPEFKKGRIETRLALSFSDDDKVGTIQPHDDTLVVTFHIRRYDVKRVLVDQGNGVEIIYPNLYKGLNLKPNDLVSYNSPLVGFDGKTITPKDLIKLPVQAGAEVVKVDFIVVDAYSPHITILARPWLHNIGVFSSTLHLKVKYPSRDHVEELIGSQAMAKQCLVAPIRHQSEGEPLDIPERPL